ncbi:MAG: type VI secretion system tube protein Hcp [Gammaproteobacteria bacterium]|nr:type VI secretion system tube protein Hcp [Gammaproteobacteria bacterium]
MTIYLHVPNQKGNVTAKGYEGWIEATGLTFSAEREALASPDNTSNRIFSHIQAHEIHLFKDADRTSPFFFSEACTGKAIPEVTIDVVTATNMPLIQYKLENVLVSEYDFFAISDDQPIEALAFNFTHLEIRYFSNEQGLPGPISAKVQTGSKPSHAAQLKRQLTKRSDEGFKLFVATVYGEAAGQSEAAWQAVASSIINRVNSKYFRCGEKGHTLICSSTDEVITQPSWYEAYGSKNKTFRIAWHYLSNQNTSKPPHLDRMITLLKPIYYDNKLTTDADHYYSPNAQKNGHDKNPEKYTSVIPGWVLRGKSRHELVDVNIPRLQVNDDFRFLKKVSPRDNR